MKPNEEWQLPTLLLGRRVLVFDRLDSTNTFALDLAGDPTNDGLVVLASEQTAGRGQHGRSWSCPGGAGVLMSVLVFPPEPLRRPAVLTAWAACAVCGLIGKMTGLEATIKWPNDVLIQGRKVCGILLEQRGGTVAGIGLNVNQPTEHFEAAGLPNAASLAMLSGQRLDCRDVAVKLLVELDGWYDILVKGNVGKLENEWKQRIGLLGRHIEIDTPTGRHAGQLQDINFDAVQVRLADGQVLKIPPEGVRHLQPSRQNFPQTGRAASSGP